MAGFWREVGKRISRSPGWGKVRARRIEIDGGRCRACGRMVNLQVHHVRPFNVAPALELDIRNTITLCGRCHIMLGHLDNWKSHNAQVVHDAHSTFSRIKGRP